MRRKFRLLTVMHERSLGTAKGKHHPIKFRRVSRLTVSPIASLLIFFFSGFQNLGDISPGLVADDGTEAFEADETVADMGVAIDARAEVFFAVVGGAGSFTRDECRQFCRGLS